MATTCNHCGGTDIDVDPQRGESICTSCGVVLTDHGIVNEVQFSENSAGQSSAVGQFVSHEGGSGPLLRGQYGMFSRESRETTT